MKTDKPKVSKDTSRAFWLMVVAQVFGIILCANILFGAITLLVIDSWSNWAFWQVIIGGVGLMLFITFLYDGMRKYWRMKKNE